MLILIVLLTGINICCGEEDIDSAQTKGSMEIPSYERKWVELFANAWIQGPGSNKEETSLPQTSTIDTSPKKLSEEERRERAKPQYEVIYDADRDEAISDADRDDTFTPKNALLTAGIGGTGALTIAGLITYVYQGTPLEEIKSPAIRRIVAFMRARHKNVMDMFGGNREQNHQSR